MPKPQLVTDPAEHKASVDASKAWKWIKETQKRTFTEWLKIGEGFRVGRAWAMRRASVNRPQGRGYNEAFSEWLEAYDMHDISQTVRADLFKLMDTPKAIEWRNTLPDDKRNDLNNPTTIWRNWQEHLAEDGKPALLPPVEGAASLSSLAQPAGLSAEMIEAGYVQYPTWAATERASPYDLTMKELGALAQLMGRLNDLHEAYKVAKKRKLIDAERLAQLEPHYLRARVRWLTEQMDWLTELRDLLDPEAAAKILPADQVAEVFPDVAAPAEPKPPRRTPPPRRKNPRPGYGLQPVVIGRAES